MWLQLCGAMAERYQCEKLASPSGAILGFSVVPEDTLTRGERGAGNRIDNPVVSGRPALALEPQLPRSGTKSSEHKFKHEMMSSLTNRQKNHDTHFQNSKLKSL